MQLETEQRDDNRVLSSTPVVHEEHRQPGGHRYPNREDTMKNLTHPLPNHKRRADPVSSSGQPAPSADDFVGMDSAFTRLRSLAHRMSLILEEAVGLKDDFNTAIDAAETKLSDAKTRVQKHSDDQQAIIDDLKNQLAAGSGLSAADGATLLSRLQTLGSEIDQTAQDLPATLPSAGGDGGETAVTINP
jgi:hypothetical protein